MVLYTHTHTHTHTVHLENKKIGCQEINKSKIDKTAIKNKKGITLIALVITIIVLLILAGVSIAMLTGTNGILTQEQKAKLSTELSSYKEQLELYKTEKLSENREFLESTLTVGKENLKYNTQPEGEIGNIKTVIPNIKDEYIDKVEIIKGSLLINTQDKNEIEIAKSLGIAANPYDIVNGELLSSNGNLLLMDETGTLTIPDSVTKIGEGAFSNLDGLKTIIIPGTVKEIGKGAFQFDSTLETVIIQEGVERIDQSAFNQCINLKRIEMPESIKRIDEYAFNFCESLSSIEIPSKITEITGSSFGSCIKLSNVKFRGDKVTKINGSAFGNTAIKSINITKDVQEISNSAFTGCSNLEKINIDAQNKNYVYESGILMSSNKEQVLFVSRPYYKNMTTFSIPDGIKEFDVNMSSFGSITNMIIPKSVEKLSADIFPNSISNVTISGENENYKIFENCVYSKDNTSLILCFSSDEEIKLTNEFKIAQSYCFKTAKNVKKITLPDSVTDLKDYCLGDSSKKLEEVILGTKLSNIALFKEASNYNFKITIDSKNPNFMVEDNIIYSKNGEKLVSVINKIQGEFTVKSRVKEICKQAFYSQYGMTKINLNTGLESIGTAAFDCCSGLTSIEIPSNVKSIEWGAFANDKNIDLIKINKPENSISGAPWGAPKGMKVINWNR